jgi:cation transport ATPase
LLLFFNINSRGFEKQERDARDGEVAGLMTWKCQSHTHTQHTHDHIQWHSHNQRMNKTQSHLANIQRLSQTKTTCQKQQQHHILTNKKKTKQNTHNNNKAHITHHTQKTHRLSTMLFSSQLQHTHSITHTHTHSIILFLSRWCHTMTHEVLWSQREKRWYGVCVLFVCLFVWCLPKWKESCCLIVIFDSHKKDHKNV